MILSEENLGERVRIFDTDREGEHERSSPDTRDLDLHLKQLRLRLEPMYEALETEQLDIAELAQEFVSEDGDRIEPAEKVADRVAVGFAIEQSDAHILNLALDVAQQREPGTRGQALTKLARQYLEETGLGAVTAVTP